MSKLHWKLLIPLLLFSVLSFFVAKSLNSSLDYSSIFLNLTTDFVMVVVTIYYVDAVLKDHEEKKWERADYSIVSRIANTLLLIIEQICTKFDLGQLMQEMYPKLYNHRGTPQTAVYLYFISEMSKKPTADFEKKFMALSEEDREHINAQAKRCTLVLADILKLYGNRIPPQLLLEIVDTQQTIQSFLNEPSKDGFGIYILLEALAKIVETTKVDRLDYYMKVDKEQKIA